MRSKVSLRVALAAGTAVAALAVTTPISAQETVTTDAEGTSVTSAPAAQVEDGGREIIVTGSRIRQDPTRSALPLQIITTEDLTREGINSPEQLISYLSTNGKRCR